MTKFNAGDIVVVTAPPAGAEIWTGQQLRVVDPNVTSAFGHDGLIKVNAEEFGGRPDGVTVTEAQAILLKLLYNLDAPDFFLTEESLSAVTEVAPEDAKAAVDAFLATVPGVDVGGVPTTDGGLVSMDDGFTPDDLLGDLDEPELVFEDAPEDGGPTVESVVSLVDELLAEARVLGLTAAQESYVRERFAALGIEAVEPEPEVEVDPVVDQFVVVSGRKSEIEELFREVDSRVRLAQRYGSFRSVRLVDAERVVSGTDELI